MPLMRLPFFSRNKHKPKLSLKHPISSTYKSILFARKRFRHRKMGDDVRAAFSSLKMKASNYMNTLAAKNAANSYGREISRLVSVGNVASGTNEDIMNQGAIEETPPSDDEILIVYPSYCRETDDGMYEVDVRGCLYLPGMPNRKSRMVLATAKRIAGVKSSDTYSRPSQGYSSTSKDEDLIYMSDTEDDGFVAQAAQEPPSRASSNLSTFSQEETLKARLAPFLTRPVTYRKIKITFGGLTDESSNSMKEFAAITESSGRFSTRIKLHHKPSIVSVQAHDTLVSFEEVIYVPPTGISVISDIDDTIKNTGILGNKRDLFRNVFVHDYEKISIEGVQQWYHKLYTLGVQFHYVSNSPWQLYPTISEYIRNSNFPRGSMHLKEYSGFLNGLFEPAAEKKRINLTKIFSDFPRRKFILVGDSGEGDLEAYIDIGRRYPSQVLAIYIRDVTLPPDDKFFLSEYQCRKNLHSHDLKSRTNSMTSLMDLEGPSVSIPPRPPAPRKGSTPLNVSPAATGERPIPQLPTSRGEKPTPPPKPAHLQMHQPPPPLPPRPSFSPSQSSSSLSVNSSSNLDNSLYQQNRTPSPLGDYAPPPPLPRRTNPPVLQSSSQDSFEFADVMDKRVEAWKMRFLSARSQVPNQVQLYMWRKGMDVMDESIQLVENNLTKN